jgi:hypothetical protein
VHDAIIYFRPSLAEAEEVEALAALGIPWTSNRATIPPGSLVVGRYSVLPYYDELVLELAHGGSKLINSLGQHRYVADLGSYVSDLGDMTPRTWSRLSDVPQNAGPFVLKGATNSKKHQWNTHMFAPTWEDAVQVNMRLNEDSLVGNQHVYIRQHVPLVRLGVTLTGLPITKEFRTFVYHGDIISTSFYWSSYVEDIIEQGHKIPSPDEVPQEFLRRAIDLLDPNVNFYVIDVAQDETGRWWVIDVNDGQMSGLQGTDPMSFYSKLWSTICSKS